MIFFLAFFKWNQASFMFFSVYNDFLNTLLNIIRIFNVDIINSISESSGKFEITEAFWNTWIDAEPIIGWLYTQDCLRQIPESPCCCTGQPAVLCLTMEDCVSTCNHL